MNNDFRDLLSELNAADARNLVVGAYAWLRATGDLEIWVEATPTNAPRMMSTLIEFGAPLMGLTQAHRARVV